jgi:predicted nucleic acid-binding Zn ribbon protein
MSFDSLSKLLKRLEQDQTIPWDNVKRHRHLVNCWLQVVSPNTAKHTRALYLQREILSVATSSAAWAQTLSLQRYQLKKKLSLLLDEPVEDIRFSSAHWLRESSPLTNQIETSQLCPKCQIPAKTFEIERWGICSCCIVQIWSEK